MKREEKNKQLILDLFSGISGKEKTEQLMARFVEDPKLIKTLFFLEIYFPKYELLVDEITAEGDRVTVQARSRGKPSAGEKTTISKRKSIEFPFAIGCRIKGEKIIHHWFVADQISLLKEIMAASKME